MTLSGSPRFFKARAYLLNSFIYGSECRLLIIMVNPPIAMKDVNPMLLSSSAVAAVDAVVRPVVPMAREQKQAFCGTLNRQ